MDVEDEGELPEVDVRGGELPEIDVEGPEIDIGTEEKTITVPDIDIDLPDDDDPDDIDEPDEEPGG